MTGWDEAFRGMRRGIEAEAREAVRARIDYAERNGLDVVEVLEESGWLATPRIVSAIETDLFDDLIGMVENLSARELFNFTMPGDIVDRMRSGLAQFLRTERDAHIHPNG